MVLVSACLLGTHCRFDGSAAPADILVQPKSERGYLPVCPEQLGGWAATAWMCSTGKRL